MNRTHIAGYGWLIIVLVLLGCVPDRDVIGTIPAEQSTPLSLLPQQSPTPTTTPVIDLADLPTLPPIIPTPVPTRPLATVPIPTPVYITAAPAFDAVVSGEEGVNLREGASYFQSVIRILDRGTPLTLTGRSSDSQWFEVLTPGGEFGWVLGSLITIRITTDSLPITWARQSIACGVNIHPLTRQGWDPLPSDLARVEWVRFPFISAAASSMDSIYAYYDPIIQTYHALGIKVLLILNQETYAGSDRDFGEIVRGDWDAYMPAFADRAGQIAARYGDQVAAYQIWNEGDAEPGNGVSIPLTPPLYARLLQQTAGAIRRVSPNSQIIFQGLMSGPDSGAAYVQGVRAALGGSLPVDAIAFHPYGMGAPGDTTPFTIFGTLDQVIAPLQRAAPGVPIWITEIGAMGTDNPDDWDDVARYMRGVYRYFDARADQVPVVMWYAWSDAMHLSRKTNGLFTLNQQPKPYVHETFFNELCGR